MFLLIRISPISLQYPFTDFNTSHVSINRATVIGYVIGEGYFNTSHVSINLFSLSSRKSASLFQYISCFY